jgi:hypothetical protein
MAQISRPFQVALALAALLLAVWFLALRSHGSSSGSGSPSAPAAQTSSSSSSSSSHPSSPGSPSSVYHGPAPGVEGLTRAIAKAHGAVATSEQNAKQLEHRSDEASSTSSAGSSSSSAPQGTHSHTHTGAGSTTVPKHASGSTTHASGAPSRQAAVESALHKGKIAVILFWNPNGSDDVLVHRELGVLMRLHHNAAKAKGEEVRQADRFFGLELDKQLAVFESPASAVAAYGSITRGIQVYSTPTLVVVNRHGTASVLTGFADAYTIEQAIEETRHA